MIKALPQGIVQKEVQRYLNFKLTKSEVEAYGRKAADVSFDLGQATDEFDGIKKEWKRKIDNLDSELGGILATIRAGKEDRHVKCIECKDFEQNKVLYLYDGHVMLERPMEDNERQFQIFDHGAEEVNKDIVHHMRSETSALNG